jgi:hypothetical protein
MRSESWRRSRSREVGEVANEQAEMARQLGMPSMLKNLEAKSDYPSLSYDIDLLQCMETDELEHSDLETEGLSACARKGR